MTRIIRFDSISSDGFVEKTVEETGNLPLWNKIALGVLLFDAFAFLFFFVCSWYSFFYGPLNQASIFIMENTQSQRRRSLFWICLYSTFALIGTTIPLAAMSLGPLVGLKYKSDRIPGIVLPIIYSSTYVYAHFCYYQFLWTRNQMTKFRVSNQRLYNYLLVISWLLMMSLPILFPLLGVLFWRHEIVIVDGNHYSVPKPLLEVTAAYAMADPGLAITFLLLFIWPLAESRRNLESIRKSHRLVDETSQKLYMMMKKTTFWAVGAAFITFVTMVAYATEEYLDSPENVEVAVNTFANFEMLLVLFCLTRITRVWYAFPGVRPIFTTVNQNPHPLSANPIRNNYNNNKDHKIARDQKLGEEVLALEGGSVLHEEERNKSMNDGKQGKDLFVQPSTSSNQQVVPVTVNNPNNNPNNNDDIIPSV